MQPARAERRLRLPDRVVGVAGDVGPQQRECRGGQQELAADRFLAEELGERLGLVRNARADGLASGRGLGHVSTTPGSGQQHASADQASRLTDTEGIAAPCSHRAEREWTSAQVCREVLVVGGFPVRPAPRFHHTALQETPARDVPGCGPSAGARDGPACGRHGAKLVVAAMGAPPGLSPSCWAAACRRENRLVAGGSRMPRPGLEPGTPRFFSPGAECLYLPRNTAVGRLFRRSRSLSPLSRP